MTPFQGFEIVPLEPVFLILLLVVAVIAGIYDWRFRRIPNWLTLAGVIAGFSSHCYLGWVGGGGAGTLSGLATAGKGFGIAALVYLALYLVHGMGAGDVKLMAALGCIAGPTNWFVLFLATSILGAAVAVCLSLARGRLYSTLWNVGQIVKELTMFRVPYKRQPQLELHHVAALRTPHGTIIAATAVLLAIARWL